MKILLINGGPKKAGATAKIIELLESNLSKQHKVNAICIGEKNINYCLGCKKCYVDGVCCQNDDCLQIIKSIYDSDAVIMVAPSYWGDVPGQLKVFIDRCTPYSNTNQNKKVIQHNVLGYGIALRTGPNHAECERIIKSINHYYGHMGIEFKGSIYFFGMGCYYHIKAVVKNAIILSNQYGADTEVVRNKLKRSYDKLSLNSKEVFEEKYNTIIEILN